MTTLTSRHPVTFWVIFLILSAVALYEVNTVYTFWSYNRLIDHPEEISESDSNLPPEVLFSRAIFLNRKGEYQQALRLYNKIKYTQDEEFQTRVQYNMGVIYLQQAAKLWNASGVWEYNQINTLLDLAEQSFKEVLTVDPGHWQAKFNLEYALRIRPPAKEEENSDWTGRKASVYAIMPGIPGGGP